MKKLLIIVPLLFPLQGCDDANATSPAPTMEYEILHESQYNEYANSTSKSAITINNKIDYESELIKRTSEAAKAVNFQEESILLIDMGAKNSGGHSLNVTFTESDDYIRASVFLSFPGDNCLVTMALTNPFKFIKLNTTKKILVTEEMTFTSC